MKIEKIIRAIRNSDMYIPEIYTRGGCYQFYKILKEIFPYAIAYYNPEKQHVLTLYRGIFWDINGKALDVAGYHVMSLSEKRDAEKWSFHASMVLSIKECPFCHEPITI